MTTATIPMPPQAILMTMESPGFTTQFPKIIHPELIPIEALRRMERTWAQGCFDPRPIRFGLLEDVVVAEEGLVFDTGGALILESITQHSEAEIARGSVNAAALRRDGTGAQAGTYVLCKKRGVGNYGHWMAEMLPRAFLAQHWLRDPALRYLVPATASPLDAIVAQSLAALGIASAMATGPHPVRVERLLLIDGLAQHGGYLSPLVMECFDRVAAATAGSGVARLLVTRDGASGRRFVDELDLKRRAVGLGYRPIDPGGMTLAEQVAAFRDATHIVGAMGAGLTNIAFTRPGARITVIAPAPMPDTFFWFLANLRGHDYQELRCTLAGETQGDAAWDALLALPPNERDWLFR